MRVRRFERDDFAARAVEFWANAMRFYSTHDDVLFMLRKHVWAHEDFARLPQYAREYVKGYERAFYKHVVDARIEFGRWVLMPDGSERYWAVGAATQAALDAAGISHRYMAEHSNTSGLYWIVAGHAGKYPFSVSAEAPAVQEVAL